MERTLYERLGGIDARSFRLRTSPMGGGRVASWIHTCALPRPARQEHDCTGHDRLIGKPLRAE